MADARRGIRARSDPESLISESDLELLISREFLISLNIRSFLLIRLCGRSICLVVVEMLIKSNNNSFVSRIISICNRKKF